MATTTPNYGWDVPTSSDYVKLGAVAIETLGDDIDATLYTINNGSARVGLHHLNTTSFSNAATVIVDSIFNSTYENYAIEFNITSTLSGLVRIRLRDGSGDSTGTNYRFSGQQIVGGSWANLDNSTTENAWTVGFNDTARAGGHVNIYGPNIALPTTYNAQSNYAQYGLYSGGSQTTSTQWTGFKIFCTSGNITGNVRVYGLRNS
jgi:hypothetical protein